MRRTDRGKEGVQLCRYDVFTSIFNFFLPPTTFFLKKKKKNVIIRFPPHFRQVHVKNKPCPAKKKKEKIRTFYCYKFQLHDVIKVFL